MNSRNICVSILIGWFFWRNLMSFWLVVRSVNFFNLIILSIFNYFVQSINFSSQNFLLIRLICQFLLIRLICQFFQIKNFYLPVRSVNFNLPVRSVNFSSQKFSNPSDLSIFPPKKPFSSQKFFFSFSTSKYSVKTSAEAYLDTGSPTIQMSAAAYRIVFGLLKPELDKENQLLTVDCDDANNFADWSFKIGDKEFVVESKNYVLDVSFWIEEKEILTQSLYVKGEKGGFLNSL